MPTGYTEIIEREPDLTLRTFTLRCARAFGACVMQRDEDIDSLPRVEAPSTYHAEQLRKAEGKLRELRGMSLESAEALYRSECASVGRQNKESMEHAIELENRYMRMRAMVEAWTPPTTEHVGLKTFMLNQIEQCKSDWTPYMVTVPESAGVWLAQQIASAERDVAYHAEGKQKDDERYAECKAWIEALYASLEPAK